MIRSGVVASSSRAENATHSLGAGLFLERVEEFIGLSHSACHLHAWRAG